MLTLPAARWTQPELVRRIAVTLAVLALYRAGSHVPLPGLDVGLLLLQAPSRGSGAYIGLVSIMTLGMTPLLSALVLVEMTKTFWPRFSAWAAVPHNGRRVEQATVAAALVLAALQAGGLAVALEDVVGLVPDPGFGFRAGVVVSLTAATAVLVWLAAVMSQHGIGHGFWILLVAPSIATASQRVIDRAGEFGASGPTTIALSALLLVVSIAGLAALLKAKPPFTEPTEPAWVSILGFALAGWVVTAAWVALVLVAPEQAPPFEQVAAHDVFLLLGLGGMALVAGLRRRSPLLESGAASGAVPVGHTPGAAVPLVSLAAAVPLVAALIGIVAFGTVLSHISDASLILPPTKVLLLAAAGLIVLDGMARPEFELASLPTSGTASTPNPQS